MESYGVRSSYDSALARGFAAIWTRQKSIQNRNRHIRRLLCVLRNFAGTTATLKPDSRGQLIGQVMTRISCRGLRLTAFNILRTITKDRKRGIHTHQPGHYPDGALALLKLWTLSNQVRNTIIKDKLNGNWGWGRVGVWIANLTVWDASLRNDYHSHRYLWSQFLRGISNSLSIRNVFERKEYREIYQGMLGTRESSMERKAYRRWNQMTAGKDNH